jgi:hypothetical protein
MRVDSAGRIILIPIDPIRNLWGERKECQPVITAVAALQLC